jgi:hypothetical protein
VITACSKHMQETALTPSSACPVYAVQESDAAAGAPSQLGKGQAQGPGAAAADASQEQGACVAYR